jgi:hypothetical protein
MSSKLSLTDDKLLILAYREANLKLFFKIKNLKYLSALFDKYGYRS